MEKDICVCEEDQCSYIRLKHFFFLTQHLDIRRNNLKSVLDGWAAISHMSTMRKRDGYMLVPTLRSILRILTSSHMLVFRWFLPECVVRHLCLRRRFQEQSAKLQTRLENVISWRCLFVKPECRTWSLISKQISSVHFSSSGVKN